MKPTNETKVLVNVFTKAKRPNEARIAHFIKQKRKDKGKEEYKWFETCNFEDKYSTLEIRWCVFWCIIP